MASKKERKRVTQRMQEGEKQSSRKSERRETLRNDAFCMSQMLASFALQFFTERMRARSRARDAGISGLDKSP